MTPFPFSKSPAIVLPQSPPYFVSNFGYWEGDDSYRTAGIKFLSKFASLSEIRPQSKILEVGSGLGGSLVYWSKHFQPKLLSAINLPGEQSDFAEQLFASTNTEILPFVHGGWEEIKSFEDSSYQFVFSLDASYHFQDLQLFYQESFRVLEPGGRFVFSNFQIKDKQFKKLWWLYLPFLIPNGNLKPTNETIAELESIGFEKIRHEEWTIPVLQGFIQYSKTLPASLKAFGKVLDLFVKKFGLTYYYYVFQK
ncbi:SAM-dependent methyltransferase [Leptospira congkakensis]|uniref:SAM-dependent methyltransferase n=1 Tax=Leptospira congkakensis TaxID=2484932 RepID=A0A4Z1AGS1_9LEPT|nr:class I SAM-dependent methyltransferase [Leptospira congkakensis]TGL87743.1 SAM-dependent methyltransferase [Leptospira congkakensis]TGL89641.1 SAM-dependent methyltransferase [Leptospira congkakensis]TGL95893.1 SAM-dependent methyltransferase [Leptospira congkakensis]